MKTIFVILERNLPPLIEGYSIVHHGEVHDYVGILSDKETIVVFDQGY
jgi:hypothetical protein